MMYFISVVIIIVTTLMFVLFASGETDTNNIVFLKGYGWEVRTKSVEKEDIIIPKPFDRVYENYNDIQLKAGLDLRPYMGMKGVRYTYIVENYPKDVGEEVRANVICTTALKENGTHRRVFRITLIKKPEPHIVEFGQS